MTKSKPKPAAVRTLPPKVPSDSPDATPYAVIRPGGPPTVFTIGYEGRDGEEVIDLLLEAGVEHLADIRARPISRKPDFRAGALKRQCEAAGIEYGPWQDLGTPDPIRARLKATRNLGEFRRSFLAHARESMQEPLERLGELALTKRVALLCFERAHDECHRSTVADLIADRIGAGITAIV